MVVGWMTSTKSSFIMLQEYVPKVVQLKLVGRNKRNGMKANKLFTVSVQGKKLLQFNAIFSYNIVVAPELHFKLCVFFSAFKPNPQILFWLEGK